MISWAVEYRIRLMTFPLGIVFVLCLPSTISAQWWAESTALARAYVYKPVSGIHPNVFTERGTTFSILLMSKDRGGNHDGDQIGIWDITSQHRIPGLRFDIVHGAQSKTLSTSGGADVVVKVVVENRKNQMWLKVSVFNSVSYNAPLASLYWWRARSTREQTWCGRTYFTRSEGGATVKSTFYDSSVARYFDSPAADISQMTPLYVVPTADARGPLGNRIPIADTGCFMHRRSDGNWYDSPD